MIVLSKGGMNVKIKTFQYTKAKGWSDDQFPDWDSENTLILIFAAPEFVDDTAPLKKLANYYPKSKIIGCSGAGEILGSYINDHSMSIAIVQFEKTPIKIVQMDINKADDSYEAGKKLALELDQKDLRGIFILSEGLNINGTELVKGINSINKHDAIITGGLAGDGKRFEKTWVIFNGEVFSKKIVAVAFYGNAVRIGHGSKGGWDQFGVERVITRSNRNVLYELDGKPVLALYKEYLGNEASGLPATGLLFPLAIRKDVHEEKQLVRTILAIDEKEGSLIFAGDIPQGYLAQLMKANLDRLITGATEAGRLLIDNDIMKDQLPILLIAVSCVGRRLVLGERSEEEVQSVLELFPDSTQQIGFYSYGELSPLVKGNPCELHNQTMTLTSICEEI
jgi:hypothetical protein